MKSNVATWAGDTSTTMKTQVGIWLNTRLRELYGRFDSIIRFDYSFTTTSGTEDYLLPDDFNKPLSVYDSTNKRMLEQVNYHRYLSLYESDTTSLDAPVKYMVFDDICQTQPSSAGTITIVSTSASDTTQTIYVRGIVSSVEDTETITLNGTTTATGTKSFSRILSMTKSASTIGKITVTRSSDTLAVFRPEALTYRVTKIRLMRIPNGTYTIQIKYTIHPYILNNDGDFPLIDICDIMEIGALADAWRYKRQNGKAVDQEVLYEKAIQEKFWDLAKQPDNISYFTPNIYRPTNLY